MRKNYFEAEVMGINNNTAVKSLATIAAVKDIDKTSENDSTIMVLMSTTRTEHQPGVYTYDFIAGEHRWDRLHFLTKQKAYSNSIFKDGSRSIENVTGLGGVIIYDIDDGYTLIEAKNILEQYQFLMITTSSHKKDKKGTTCDRFRIIFNTDVRLDMTNDEHKKFMALLAEEIGLDPTKLDSGCFNIAAAYKPAPSQLHYYNEGIKVPVEKMQSMAKELVKAEKIIKEYTPQKEYVPDKQKILDALNTLDPDMPYSDWFKVGAALKTEFSEEGFSYFDSWSSGGRGYSEIGTQKKWNTLKNGMVSGGTIIRMAG